MTLSLISTAELAVATRDRFGMGALLCAGTQQAIIRTPDGAGLPMRPHAVNAVAPNGAGRPATVQVQLGRPQSSKQFAYQTRIATSGGAASGAHPAWDPV